MKSPVELVSEANQFRETMDTDDRGYLDAKRLPFGPEIGVDDVENLNNRLNVIDFGGLFSGNAIAPARSYSARFVKNF